MADQKLSPESDRAVQDFAATARAWGVMVEKRTGSMVSPTYEAFTRAEKRIRRRLLKLEKAVKFAQGVAELYRHKLEEKEHG
jgi:hypothetical protein